MALNDSAVVTAAQGFVFIATPGTAAPTPTELAALDPELFGAKTVKFKVTGTPTSYVITIDGEPTSALPLAASAAVVQTAVEGVVGPGNAVVSGVGAGDTDGVDITFIGSLQNENVVVTAGAFVGGTSPAAVVTTVTALNGWNNIGHTSRDDMPEFGFDGGDSEVKGTWQNAKLREVVTETAADFLTLNLNQIDETSLALYYGENASSTPGVFGVSGDESGVNEYAFLVIIVDGSAKIGFYAPKASVKRDDSISLPVDDFAALPIKATFLKMPGRRLFDWISSALFPNA